MKIDLTWKKSDVNNVPLLDSIFHVLVAMSARTMGVGLVQAALVKMKEI